MQKSNITYQPSFRSYSILTDQKHNLGCYTEILESTSQLFDAMLTKHHKVFFMRFDVHFPLEFHYPNNNEIFKGFIGNFIKHLKRKKLDPLYLWTRENNGSVMHHYHCFVLLNGSKTQSIYGHLAKAEELWGRALGFPNDGKGLIDYCNRSSNGVELRRGDTEALNYCFNWASYLAKVNTKNNIPGVRNFGSSLRCS